MQWFSFMELLGTRSTSLSTLSCDRSALWPPTRCHGDCRCDAIDFIDPTPVWLVAAPAAEAVGSSHACNSSTNLLWPNQSLRAASPLLPI